MSTEDAISPPDRSEHATAMAAGYLSFYLADELYGVSLSDVEEIRVWEPPTPVPRSPDCILGVINLRGMIIPVQDLRVRFAIGRSDYLPTTVVLVLRYERDDERRMMGVVVDAVSDVVELGEMPLSSVLVDSVVTPFLSGILNVQDEVMSLFNTAELLDIESLTESRE